MNSEKEAENLLQNFSNRHDFEKFETCVLFDVPFTEYPYAQLLELSKKFHQHFILCYFSTPCQFYLNLKLKCLLLKKVYVFFEFLQLSGLIGIDDSSIGCNSFRFNVRQVIVFVILVTEVVRETRSCWVRRRTWLVDWSAVAEVRRGRDITELRRWRDAAACSHCRSCCCRRHCHW